MADAVGSAVAQEAVSRAVSFVLSNREAATSKRHNIERLEMAHTELEFALERSGKLPITDVSLLRQRRMVKRAYEECGDALQRCKLRVLEDRMTPKKKFLLEFLLRLSESTDVVGIAIKCLQLLGPVFKPFAEVAMGELTQLPMQDVSRSEVLLETCLSAAVPSARNMRPDLFCCRADGHGPCANDTMTSKFPAQVAFMCFVCYIPAFEYDLRSSADGAGGNVLQSHAAIASHHPSHGVQESSAVEIIGGREERINGSLRQMEEMLHTNAIDLFIRQPEQTEYDMFWRSAHGGAHFSLRKIITVSSIGNYPDVLFAKIMQTKFQSGGFL